MPFQIYGCEEVAGQGPVTKDVSSFMTEARYAELTP